MDDAGAIPTTDVDTVPNLYFGQLDKQQFRQFQGLVAKVSAMAAVHGRGQHLLEYVYLSGLSHGAQVRHFHQAAHTITEKADG